MDDDGDDDLWGSNDESGDEEQADNDGDDPMQESVEASAQATMTSEDIDMEENTEDTREPARSQDPDETAKLDSNNAGGSAQSFAREGIPPSVLRRQLFVPTSESLTQHLVLDPFIVIPQPGHVHSLTATPCMSYLLTGSEDGYVRAYDFWASANGKNMLSTQQRAMATLGEGVNKGGVIRGYYKNEVEVEEVVEDEEEQPENAGPALPWMQAAAEASKAKKEVTKIRKMQPVHSLAVQGDALWAVSGTEAGHINLTTLRHDPGKIVHVFDTPDRHSKPVSQLLLTSDEQHMISGGWDNHVKEWDLNTGQVVRSFTRHKGPISTIQFRPVSLPAIKSNTETVTITAHGGNEAGDGLGASKPTGDTEMDAVNAADAAGSPDSYGSLFGDEEEDDGSGEKQEKSVPAEKTAKDSVTTQSVASSALPPALQSLPPALQTSSAQTQMPPSRPGILSAGLKGQPRVGLPPLVPETYRQFSDDVMLVASMDGEVALHDRRIESSLVGKLEGSLKSGPWCMSACFSADGTQVIAGRRNASLDVWDVRKGGASGTKETPNLLRTLRHPATSQWVSAVAAFPDGKHIACASVDCVRLWNTADLWNPESNMKKSKSGVPFRIVAGHHDIDPTGQYMVTATGNRGWAGDATKVVLVHERK